MRIPRLSICCAALVLFSSEGRAQQSRPAALPAPAIISAADGRSASAADIARGAGRGAVVGAVAGGVVLPILVGESVKTDGEVQFLIRTLQVLTGAAVGALIGAGIAAAH